MPQHYEKKFRNCWHSPFMHFSGEHIGLSVFREDLCMNPPHLMTTVEGFACRWVRIQIIIGKQILEYFDNVASLLEDFSNRKAALSPC